MKLALLPRIVILLVLLTLTLVVMVGIKQYTLNTGKVILLKTEPVDPRSLFRGDYVRLNYTVSRFRLDEIAGDNSFKRHDAVYVVLEKRKPYWQAVSVHHNQPLVGMDQIFIKGEIKYASNYLWNRETRKSEKVHNIQVRYGIENYFVPEGQGRVLENLKQSDQVDMQIAVDKYGHAGIKGVLVNGEQRYIETLF